MTRNQKYPINSLSSWLHVGITHPKILISGFIVILIIIAFNSYRFNNANWNSTLTLKELKEPVNVFRDEHGIAYIQAQNLHDALLTQGFVTAQDRLLQLELYRYIAKGRASEILGQSSFQHDVKMRTINLTGLAQKHWQRLKSDSKLFISRYIEGINLYIKTQSQEYPIELQWIGTNLQLWKPEDVLTLMYFLSWSQSASYETQWLEKKMINAIDQQQLKQWLPIEHFFELSDSLLSGNEDIENKSNFISGNTINDDSNNQEKILKNNSWVLNDSVPNSLLVDHKHTISGKPILANDLKLNIKLPYSMWYPISLHTPDLYFSGFSLSGIPGILSGRNNYIAFGLMDHDDDMQSLIYIPKENEQEWLTHIREEIIKVAIEDNFEEKTIHIKETAYGPIISDHFEDFNNSVQSIALSWTPFKSKRSSVGIDKLLSSKNIRQAQQALQNTDILPFDWVLADRSNNIGMQLLGDIVSGSKDSWVTDSSIKNEQQLSNKKHSYINQRQGFYENDQKVTADDVWSLIGSKSSLQTGIWLPYILNVLEKKPGYLDWYQELKIWDGLELKDEVAPTLYHLICMFSFVNILLQNFPSEIVEDMLDKPKHWQKYFVNNFMSNERIVVGSKQVSTKDYIESIIHQSVVMVREHLISSFGGNLQEWTWNNIQENQSEEHQVISSIFSWIFAGIHIKPEFKKNFFVDQFNYFNKANQFSDVARFVVDLANDKEILGISTGGISARNFTFWIDNFEDMWRENHWFPIWIDPDMQRKQARYHMTLNSR